MSSRGNPQSPTPPKYLNDFSKALAGEVRILLAEVGKLRDERRQLQYEIAELMNLKSKHGAGGEYAPDWRPKIEGPPPEEPPPPPAIEDAPPPQARPGWRVIHKRPERRERPLKIQAAPTSAQAPAPAPEPPRPELPAWAQWRPNPLLAPVATPASMSRSPPPRSGLFGPPTPPPK
ncbi:hypothetical protein BDZ94DRAFT_1261734 [Collybia nuda]|uniref:Uncharacterized protein n=1 Tax=Collybia nuda TaxID=64659 RepID=A0A9P5Y5U5_9AGAR|nr:hypothetical protein BDZ94DRAFT_1261734 [Collybia nuda]